MGTHASTRAAAAALALSAALAACAAFSGSAGEDDSEGDGRGQGPPGAPTILEDGAVLPPSGDDASLPFDAGSDFDAAAPLRHLTFEDGLLRDARTGADAIGQGCAPPDIDNTSALEGVYALRAKGANACVQVAVDGDELWVDFRLKVVSAPGSNTRVGLVELRLDGALEAAGPRIVWQGFTTLMLAGSGTTSIATKLVTPLVPLRVQLHLVAGAAGSSLLEAYVVVDGKLEPIGSSTDARARPRVLRLGTTTAGAGEFLLDDVIVSRQRPTRT